MNRISRERGLSWFLALSILLTFPLTAAGADYETWSGPFSFKRTRTEVSDTKQTLVKSKSTVSGKLVMYVIPNGPPTPDADGYYLRFIDSVEGFTVGIKVLDFVSTETLITGKPDPFLMVGVGEFLQGEVKVGSAYVTIKGTSLKEPTGGMNAIKITDLILGGGSSETPNFLWSGQGKATLTLQEYP
jgi:hypothetical protein